MDRIEELERTAGAGDSDAKFELAVELLSGPEAVVQLQRGITLVEEASAAGCARATELWAVFEAMGVARPQNWEGAFDRLLEAAGQGSLSARRQLLVLAGRREDQQALENPDREFWAEVRSSISIDRLLAHEERTSVSDAPRVRVIEGFATSVECGWLIDRARDRLKHALVINDAGESVLDPGRSNTGTEFLVLDMDVVLEVIRNRISAATRVPVPVFEPTQLLHYSVGEEFKPHFDFLDPSNPSHRDQLINGGQRIATFLIYLNEDFEGGETEFPEVGLHLRGKTGDALFWANLDMEGRPDPLTRHAGRPPTSGEKWILSQWIRDRRAAPQ